MIVCIGWGSLIWNPEGLPIEGEWKSDGPILPVEFLRQSSGGRVTLVIATVAEDVTTLWAAIGAPTIDTACEMLRRREKTANRYIASQNRLDPAGPTLSHKQVHAWLQDRDIEAAIWTALPPKWAGTDGRAPSEDEVVEYLRTREGGDAQDAEEYIRRTPVQIRTKFRTRIQKDLGWTPL
jgi:hypothetical protein